MEADFGINCFSTIQNYWAVVKKDQTFSEKVQQLSLMIVNANSENERNK